jgi:hypothetical protein
VNVQKSLPSGRAFEKEIFGVTDEGLDNYVRRPRRMGVHLSMQEVILSNWSMYAKALDRGLDYCHNPTSPKMGKTPYSGRPSRSIFLEEYVTDVL